MDIRPLSDVGKLKEDGLVGSAALKSKPLPRGRQSSLSKAAGVPVSAPRAWYAMQATTPPPGELLDSIRTSCASICHASNITIDDGAIRQFLSSIEEEDWAASHGADSHGIRLPLRFDSDLEELDVVCTLALLNFLSGYRIPLKRLTGRGAWDNVLALVLASHLSATDDEKSNVPLSTKGMLSTNTDKLAQLMNIRTHTEKDHPTLGSAVKVGERDPDAIEILELVEKALKETGQALEQSNKRSLGEWVQDSLIETNADAGRMLEKLADTFPPFRDVHLIDGQPCFLLKKALFMLSVITLTFSAPGRQKPSFPLPEVHNLPIFADNVIPTDGREWLKDMKEVNLDAYLWSIGKKGGLRNVQRLAQRQTYLY
ncbi:hypothetical protein OIV83_003277 [Microbotryomycetes sp. JL201]|nr:hypothetical protein OIV83_003277 [Microbotryomycetes sp. JL201]